ncbi:MAG: hypothetical protein M1426_00965 [Patescibacteria group bacterium]|nr:hypothetical protein [Patescibacteria group bacterium]
MEEFNSADILKKQDRKKRLAFLEVGLFEISFVLIIIIVLFGTLNYFNILSLSALYPNQLGFLPHQPFNVQKTPLTNNLLADNPKFKNYLKLDNQATDAQMSNYIELISAKKIPIDTPQYPEEIYGIFSGFNNNYIQIVTYNGTKNLPYAKDLFILEQRQAEKSATQSSATIGFNEIDKNILFNNNMFGKILHLSITLTSPETVKQIYLTE